MPRIRTIKPDFWKSEKVGLRLPGPDGRQARLLFIGLLNFAEDHGVCRGNPSFLRSELFGYEEDLTGADVERWLGLLEAGGFIVRFDRGGSRYIWIAGFAEHQKIDKPSRTSFPEPTRGEIERSGRTPRVLGEGSPLDREEEVDGDGKGVGEAASPLADELAAPPSLLEAQKADPVGQLREAWNELTTEPLPRWTERSKLLRDRAKAALKRRPLAEWREVFRRIEGSPFLRGESDGGWKADAEWALRPEGKKPEPAAQVLAGKYPGPRPAGSARDVRRGVARAEEQDHSQNEVGADGTIQI